MREQAAIEATAIVERAQATVIVLHAEMTASALMRDAEPAPTAPAPTGGTTLSLPVTATQPASAGQTPTLQTAAATVTAVETVSLGAEAGGATPPLQATPGRSTPVTGQTTLDGVSMGSEGLYIAVSFLAPPKVAGAWTQGMMSVTDEATGQVYDQIALAPIIGPLFGKPQHEGQLGYVMLVNSDRAVRRGSVVTVVLGSFKQEHVTVK